MKINKTKIIQVIKDLLILSLVFMLIMNNFSMKMKNKQLSSIEKEIEEKHEILIECHKGRAQYEEQIGLLNRILKRK